MGQRGNNLHSLPFFHVLCKWVSLIYLITCKVAIFCLFAVVVVCCVVYRKNVMKF